MMAMDEIGPVTTVILLSFVAAGIVAGAVLYARRTRLSGLPEDRIAEGLLRAPGLGPFLRRRLDPSAATGLALTVACLGIFAAAVAFGIVADMIAEHEGLARFDAGAAQWGARNATPLAVTVMRWFTALGSTVVVLAELVVVGVLDVRRRCRWSGVAFLATVIVGQSLLVNGVKLLVGRERPSVPHLTAATGFSFPSGHTTAAAATCAALALLLSSGRRWPVKLALGTLAAAITMAVAASRVLLGVHWLTDVVGGVLLGLGWFAVCAVAFGGYVLRFGSARTEPAPEGAAVTGGA